MSKQALAEAKLVSVQPAEPSASSESAALISMIERAARDPAVDIEKMERLFKMHGEVIAREQQKAFNIAMSQAQAEMRPIANDANNPQTRSKYASYAALDRAVRSVYTKHGFSLSYDTEPGAPENHIRVVCLVQHNGGHTRKHQADMPADGKGAKGGDVMTKTHAFGAGVTYGQRYLLKMIFNLATGADDDGNRASLAETISEDEVMELRDLIESVEAEIPKVLSYVSKKARFDVATLADIPSALYADVKQALANRANRKG